MFINIMVATVAANPAVTLEPRDHFVPVGFQLRHAFYAQIFAHRTTSVKQNAPPFSSMKRAPLPHANGGSLGWPRARNFFSKDSQSSMSRSDMSGAIAVLEEGQDPVDPSEVLHGPASFCALRGGALSSKVY
jgi:hypothetical protein